MKFSLRQMLASAAGAVLAATIASVFGVKGTIIGVAIGSLAATFGTVMVSQSIERGHAAVKQVVVKVPVRSNLLRRLGGTAASGETQTAEPGADAHDVTEPVTTAPVAGDATTQMAVPSDETSVMEIPPHDVTEAVTTASVAGDATTQMAVPSDDTGVMAIAQDHPATVTSQLPVSGGEPVTAEMRLPVRPARSIPWRLITVTAVVVFILSVVLVTAIELIAGHPLSDLFGNNKNNNPTIFQPFTKPTTTTTASTTTTSTSTTTTSSTSTTTTTTTPGETTTSTTPGQSTTTTSSGLFGSTTTTSATTLPSGG